VPRNIESTLNADLGQLLCDRHPEWTLNQTLFTECTDVIAGNAAARIDLLVHPHGGQPVAIETEFKAGPQVEKEARSRLGKTVRQSRETIESAISVGMPPALRSDPSKLGTSTLAYATHQLGKGAEISRWPLTENEWSSGTVDHLADVIELISLSERRLAEGADVLESAVSGVSTRLRSRMGISALELMAAALHQEDSEQTTRMAVSILINALMFHYALEGQPGVPMLTEDFTRSRLLAMWDEILVINYWPIFSIATQLLKCIPGREVPDAFAHLNHAAERLAALGATTFHDLTGRLFQRLIADRKFLASFYTLPASAQLLAELAADRLDVDWSDGQAICDLRIADFACGTGALISAAQRELYRRHRRAGGDDAQIHRQVIEQTLIASDIMPAATHITASILSSPHPRIIYGNSKVHTLPYGERDEKEISLGALDLLDATHARSLFGPGSQEIRGGAVSHCKVMTS